MGLSASASEQSPLGPHGSLRRRSNGHLDFRDHTLRVTELVFPDAKNRPRTVTQTPVHLTVTSHVSLYLGAPERSVALRQLEAPRTSMPEAPVDEYRQLQAWEHKIGAAESLVTRFPAADICAGQNRSELTFGRGVAA